MLNAVQQGILTVALVMNSCRHIHVVIVGESAYCVVLAAGDNVLSSVTCSSRGANKSSLYDELPQLITAEPCAKKPSRHTQGEF